MERMAFSSVCGSVGELNQGEWVSRRAVMCTNIHCCDPPAPSQLCCLLPEIANSPSSEPCMGTVKHWPEETLFSLSCGFPGWTPVCLILRCPLLPISPDSLEKPFPPQVLSKLVCAGKVSVCRGARGPMPSLCTSLNFGLKSWGLLPLHFLLDLFAVILEKQLAVTSFLLSPPFAVSLFGL